MSFWPLMETSAVRPPPGMVMTAMPSWKRTDPDAPCFRATAEALAPKEKLACANR